MLPADDAAPGPVLRLPQLDEPQAPAEHDARDGVAGFVEGEAAEQLIRGLRHVILSRGGRA